MPATTAAPPQQAPSPQQDAQLVAALAAALATYVSTAEILGSVTVLAALKTAGISPRAMRVSVDVIMSMPPEQQGFFGAATARTARLNLMRRVQFAIASSRRVMTDLKTARSRGVSLPQALREAYDRERRYFGSHLQAIWKRSQAGAQADSAAMTYGRLLGWHTVLDKRTSAECRHANGKNFLVDHMPLIGYPGGVHPHCRCYPGRPWPGGRMLLSER